MLMMSQVGDDVTGRATTPHGGVMTSQGCGDITGDDITEWVITPGG